MPVRYYECQNVECGITFRSMKDKPKCPECETTILKKLLKAPQAKFLEKLDPEKNKSRLKDSDKILKERSRNHSRDNDLMDLVQMNEGDKAIQNQWLVENSDGSLRKRKKIDDI